MLTNVGRPSAVDVLRPFAVGDIFTADTTSTLAKLADVAVGNVLLSGGVGVIPAWGKITLTSHVTGVLPAINGGTGVANTGTITNAGNITFTGTGTIATGTFTLTVPATGTAMLLSETQTVTGAKTFNATVTLAAGLLINGTIADATIELGRTDNVAASCYIDFHSGATSVDFDARLIASGGTGVSGGGDLGLTAAQFTVTAPAFVATGNLYLSKASAASPITDANSSLKIYDSGLGAGLFGMQTSGSPYAFQLQAADSAMSFSFPLQLNPRGGAVVFGADPGGSSLFRLGTAVDVAISNTTDSTSKDTGSIVTEGGIGAEKQIVTGTNFVASVAGGGLLVKEGSNAKMGIATLSGGTVTVNTTAVTANSRIFLTPQVLGTVAVASGYAVTARTASTSFTITASIGTDTSDIAWMIVEPAP